MTCTFTWTFHYVFLIKLHFNFCDAILDRNCTLLISGHYWSITNGITHHLLIPIMILENFLYWSYSSLKLFELILYPWLINLLSDFSYLHVPQSSTIMPVFHGYIIDLQYQLFISCLLEILNHSKKKLRSSSYGPLNLVQKNGTIIKILSISLLYRNNALAIVVWNTYALSASIFVLLGFTVNKCSTAGVFTLFSFSTSSM